MKLAVLLASVAGVTGFGSFETDSALPGRMTYSTTADPCAQAWPTQYNSWPNDKGYYQDSVKTCKARNDCRWDRKKDGKVKPKEHQSCVQKPAAPTPTSTPTPSSCSALYTREDCEAARGCRFLRDATTGVLACVSS